MPKKDNLLAILWMLNTGAKLTAGQIAERLELNIRTVYRYIDALCASGVPIIADSGHNGGYRLLNHFIKAPLLFDLEEKKALLHAAEFAKEAGYPGSEALDHAASKLRLYNNPEQERTLSHQLAGFEVAGRKAPPAVQSVLAELEQAIAREYPVETDYRTGREEQAKRRTIDPYGVVYWNNKWYTVGFCHLKQEIRSFRADRMLTIQPAPGHFKRPEAFSARDFFLQKMLPDLPGKGTLTTVVIAGRAEALDDLCLHWYFAHHLQKRTPGQAIFMLEEWAIQHFVPHFLLSYGKSIQITGPQSLKDRAAAVAADLAEYYRG
ncbi:helix-turn-helix transcriptional regulator [Paenibacillus sp. FSL M7-0420]|uniref:helix-turn-helix transcriptional regulator n=1 Tax=Paenibacillus sp. FSL M7-0420 TaxID=2921609 RepID=UPI0030F7A3C6